MAVFGTCAHGEDLLLLSVTDAPSDITGVPIFFYDRLSSHLAVPPAALQAGMAMRRQPARLQRHSSKTKPLEQLATTWEQVVEDCISDEEVKKAILDKSNRA